MSEAPSPATGNTLIEAGDLLPFLAANYELERPVTCELIRRGFNDHYLVTAGPKRYVLRVYFNHKYYIDSPGDFRFELDLLTFLHHHGLPVSYSLSRRDGDRLGPIQTPGGERWCALFSFAEGEESREIDLQQARKLGETVASLHQTADRFQSPHHRYHLDLKYLVEQPMELMDQFVREHGKGDLDTYRPLVETLTARVRALPREGGAYDIIHGDLHDRNFRFTGQGDLTLFDFDHSGYGWRAYDLATCQGSLPDAGWSSFLAAYQSVRPLSDTELASIPAFREIRSIWNWGDVLAMRPAWGDSEQFGEPLADEILTMFRKLRAA